MYMCILTGTKSVKSVFSFLDRTQNTIRRTDTNIIAINIMNATNPIAMTTRFTGKLSLPLLAIQKWRKNYKNIIHKCNHAGTYM